jgi:SARP family transcriptional regulator, regulator of embCAB operon
MSAQRTSGGGLGEPGEDLSWADAVRRELEDLRLRALEAAAEAGLALGGAELDGAKRSARRLVELEPYRESGYR